MKLEPFLPTRIARRVLGLFVVCVLVPAGALSVVAYVQVARQLERDALDRLREQSKAAGQILLDRLLVAAAELETLSLDSPAASGPRAAARVRLVASFRPEGTPPDDVPGEVLAAIDDRVERHLATGRPALIATRRNVYLVRDAQAGAESRRLVATLEPRLFWKEDVDLRIVPNGTDLCVIAAAGPIFCTEPHGLPPSDARAVGQGNIKWATPEGAVLAGDWALFLGYELAAEPWRLVVSQPEAAVLAPIAAFRTTFWLVVALAVGLAFGLGNVLIRRAMAPLHDLELGTRRLAEGDLDHHVAATGDDEFASVARSFNGMARSLRQQFDTLEALNQVGHSALVEPSVEAIARTTALAARRLIGAATATLAVPVSGANGTWISVAATPDGQTTSKEFRPAREHVALLQAQSEQLEPVPGAAATFLAEGAGERSVIFSITRGSELAGALSVTFESGVDPATRPLQHGRLLANQAGVALANAQTLTDLDDMSYGALVALARTIDANSPWTAGHSERVTRVALAIGQTMNLSAAELDLLHRGGLLHDIGKIAVPAVVLDKRGPLDEDEWEIMRAHPSTGVRILAPIKAFHPMIPLVRWHHERLDGSGYPDRLGGDAIPPLVRILSVADVYDALTSERPYRGAWTMEIALNHLRDRAGIEFDAAVVAAFESTVRNEPDTLMASIPALRNRGPVTIS